jgi:hypothetical protein
MRRVYIVAIVLGVILFLVISGLLARAFNAEGNERSAITALIQAEARGDTAGVISRIHNCSESETCRAQAQLNTAALRRPGSVSILQLQPSTGFSLTSTLGYARVAWNVGGSLPRVQCVKVRRAGNVLSGISIQLLSITRRLAGDATCPSLS